MTELRGLVEPLADHPEPRGRIALVAIDLQNDFCAPEGAVVRGGHAARPETIEQAASNTVGLARALRGAGVPCIFVRSFLDDKYKLPSVLRRHRALGITTRVCQEGSWGAEFYKVEVDPSDCLITKHTNDAFLYTFLEPLLRKMGADTLILSGVYTELCIEDTARSAILRGFHVFLAEDCTAGLTPACMRTSIETMRAFQIGVASSSTLVSAFAQHSGQRASAPISPHSNVAGL